MGNPIIMMGGVFILSGIALMLLGRFGLPQLPGDILIRNENTLIYFPIVSSVIISVILTIILNVFK